MKVRPTKQAASDMTTEQMARMYDSPMLHSSSTK
eukprot:CAMPEP_0206318380 /NCGR_PEP_ID=MMETSP0106_2-20121207/17155_1 /ASSEMBLY_ACC=CAM_ASM_000206 /TAXON_ID=81532 /ORGANISM="Acanthoeca-like sp., Strain 10tr" /LENGTH=33 /DNA_ID= /DNA_START= /DNA_END= /DNA_ORIENTATION=